MSHHPQESRNEPQFELTLAGVMALANSGLPPLSTQEMATALREAFFGAHEIPSASARPSLEWLRVANLVQGWINATEAAR